MERPPILQGNGLKAPREVGRFAPVTGLADASEGAGAFFPASFWKRPASSRIERLQIEKAGRPSLMALGRIRHLSLTNLETLDS